jgi:hypothetical protein
VGFFTVVLKRDPVEDFLSRSSALFVRLDRYFHHDHGELTTETASFSRELVLLILPLSLL